MRIAVAGDSAGMELARTLSDHLEPDHDVIDLSTPENDEERYAHLAERVATQVVNGAYDRAILVCGTGIGVCISANKVPGIRAALTHDTYSAQRASLSNDAQIITMGARVVGAELAKSIAESFLSTAFDPEGRSAPNVDAITEVEGHYGGV